MSNLIRTAIFQTFTLGDVYGATVQDEDGTRAATVGTGSTRTYWRIVLGKSGGDGTSQEKARSLLGAFIVAVNNGGSKWSGEITSDGHVRISYSGAGTGKLSFDPEIQALLGYDGDVELTTGTSSTAKYPPTHTLYITGKRDDEGFLYMGQRFAGRAMRNGVVYGWADGFGSWRRKFRVEWIPKDWATRESEGVKDTPFYPVATRMFQNDQGAQTAPPWTWLDFLLTSPGKRLACLFGDFQEALLGQVSMYHACYATPETYREERMGLVVPDLDAYLRLDVDLRLAAIE